MTDRPVLEAVGEVLASYCSPEEFRRAFVAMNGYEPPEVEGSTSYVIAAQEFVDRLAKAGLILSPTPIVNAGEER